MNKAEIGVRVQIIGTALLRHGVVVMLLMIGLSKWTLAEAGAIRPWVTNSPFLSRIYRIASVQTGSEIIGIVEILAAILIALRHWVPRATVLGSVIASGMFVVTLSFVATTWSSSREYFQLSSSSHV